MTLIGELVGAFARNLVRDAGTVWVKSLVLRAVLAALALVALVAAAGLLLALAQSALSAAIGPTAAALVVAAVLVLAAGGLYGANRLVRQRARRRRERATEQFRSALSMARAAVGAAGGTEALSIVAVALLAGFLFGNTATDDPTD